MASHCHAAFDVTESSRVGEARRHAVRLAESFGFDEVAAGRVALVVNELGNNLVRHAQGGRLLVGAVEDDDGGLLVEVMSLDVGPGIRDIPASLVDGFSTGGTAGQGLGAVRRLSQVFDIYSRAPGGTVVLSRLSADGAAPRTSGPVEAGVVRIPAPGEHVCGDNWSLVPRDGRWLLLVADGLGHGPQAMEAADAAVSVLAAAPDGPPSRLLERMHQALRVTRGAAAALADFVPAEARSVLDVALAQSRTGAWRGDFPLQSAQGVDVPMEWTLSAHAEPGQVLAIATDISDRVALQRQREDLLEREQAARAAAERLNRSKDEFIAVLSHELRTPLNAIVSWVHVLKRLDADASMARGLDSIERNAHVQTRLVSDILDMSRMDLGKLQLFIEPVDVPDLVRTAVSALGASAREKSLEIEISMDTVTRRVNADASRLQQIVWNLLTNAIKFSNAGGRIRVAARQDGQVLTLSVADEGIGIKSEFADLLFERFTQGDSGSNRTHGGLGLGLSIVKHLTELHGGGVTAFSEGPGRGATFTVTIPEGLAPSGLIAMPGVAPERDPTTQALSALEVLVVDDDPEAREMLTMILSERGARVTTAASAADGLERLRAGAKPQVVVSDIGMPGQDGYAFVRELRRQEAPGSHLPVVALTAFARPQDRETALAAGFDEHCGKPLRPDALVAAILRLTGPVNPPRR